MNPGTSKVIGGEADNPETCTLKGVIDLVTPLCPLLNLRRVEGFDRLDHAREPIVQSFCNRSTACAGPAEEDLHLATSEVTNCILIEPAAPLVNQPIVAVSG